MSKSPCFLVSAVFFGVLATGGLAVARAAGAAPDVRAPSRSVAAAVDPAVVDHEFTAAMQRVHQNLPEPPDSPALKSFVIYDYLVAARLRRDLLLKPTEDLDSQIDAFLQARNGQPVAHNLRN